MGSSGPSTKHAATTGTPWSRGHDHSPRQRVASPGATSHCGRVWAQTGHSSGKWPVRWTCSQNVGVESVQFARHTGHLTLAVASGPTGWMSIGPEGSHTRWWPAARAHSQIATSADSRARPAAMNSTITSRVPTPLRTSRRSAMATAARSRPLKWTLDGPPSARPGIHEVIETRPSRRTVARITQLLQEASSSVQSTSKSSGS